MKSKNNIGKVIIFLTGNKLRPKPNLVNLGTESHINNIYASAKRSAGLVERNALYL